MILRFVKWYGRQLKKSTNTLMSGDLGQPQCPYCGSTNNSLENTLKAAAAATTRASKKVTAGAIAWPAALVVGNKKTPDQTRGECFDCGKVWRV